MLGQCCCLETEAAAGMSREGQRACFKKQQLHSATSEMWFRMSPQRRQLIKELGPRWSNNSFTYYIFPAVFQISAIHSMLAATRNICKNPLLDLWSWILTTGHSSFREKQLQPLLLFKMWPILALATSLNSNWSTMPMGKKRNSTENLSRNNKSSSQSPTIGLYDFV